MIEATPAAELLACAQREVRLVAGAQQRQSAAMAELWSLRVAEELAHGATGGQAGEFVVTEIAVAVCASRRAVGDLLGVGLMLADRLGAVRAAWASGDLDLARVRVIVEHTQHVSAAHLDLVERLLLERAVASPASRLGPVIDRIVGRWEPEAVFRRRERAVLERGVSITPAPDGMAEVWGRLPALDGRILDERLDTMARSVCPDDGRTLHARRADALTALAAGTDLRCTCGCGAGGVGPGVPPVQLIITSDSLDGVSDDPAHLVGHGPVDRALADELSAGAPRWHALTDPVSGALIGLGRPGAVQAHELDAHPYRYAIGAALARLVRLRDGRCRFPGCGVPARRTDLDHREPFHHADPRAGGPTVRENLFCLCRFHHRAKTAGFWSYTHLGGAVLEWTSPTGRTYTTTAHDYGGTSPAPHRT